MISKGTILDGTYEIIDEIGVGGGGIVYKARHLRLQTDVVIKKIKDEVREKVNLRQEVDILKKLKHPYLPRVYDFLETEDGVYTVMDYISGEDLDSAIKRHGKFSPKQVKKWAEQLGDVLSYLHSQKPAIIHSDIKPANIMLMENGDICLIDFNISLAAGADAEAAVGVSAGFSPPEQYRDPALYARVTRNYTLQKLSKAVSEANKSVKVETDKSADVKTALLTVNEEVRTVLLSIMSDEEKTVLRSNMSNGEKTVLLSSMSDNEKTVLLNSMTDNEKTVLLSNIADEEKTVLLNGMPDDEKTLLLAAQSQQIKVEPVVSASQKKVTEQVKLPPYTMYMGRGIDTRSDIYSLGITLYYLVTGMEPPADFEKRIPVLETNIEISEGFAIILEKMMELKPEDRFQNGMEFYKAILSCHKLDKRYILMKRKQMGMQLASMACLFIGILFVFGGLNKIRHEQNSKYYGLIQQADACMAESDYKTAYEFIEQAKGLEAEEVVAYKEEIYLLYLTGCYEDCISLGMQYINTVPFTLDSDTDKESFGDICYLTGNAYFESEDYMNAERLFEYAMQYNTQNGLYYRDYAITLAKIGQLEKAEEYLEMGMELGIAQDSVSMVQGELAHINGLYDEAIEYLKQTISLTTDTQMKKRSVLLAVDVYKSMGNSAIDEEIQLLELHHNEFKESGSLAMLEYLADAYVRKAQTDEAIASEYYGKALVLFKELADKGYMTYQLQENMAILYENMDCFEEAEEILLQMALDYPARYEVYKRLAFLEADKQQEKENIDRDYVLMQEYYEKALEIYSGKEQDAEMEMLGLMMQELIDGGWL